MAFFGYDTFRDMFDGGGAGAVGDKFEGGGLLSDIANFFWSPEGAEERRRLEAWNNRFGPQGGGAGGGGSAGGGGLLDQMTSARPQMRPDDLIPPMPLGQSTTPDIPQQYQVPFGGYGAELPPSGPAQGPAQPPSSFNYNAAPAPSAADQMPVKDFNGGDSWYFPLGQPGGGRIDTDPRSQAGAMQRAPASEFPPQFIQEFAQTFRGADIAAAERGGQLQGAYDLWRRNGNTFGGASPWK